MHTFAIVGPLPLRGRFRLRLSCGRSFRLGSGCGSCLSVSLLLNLCQLPLLPCQLPLHLHAIPLA